MAKIPVGAAPTLGPQGDSGGSWGSFGGASGDREVHSPGAFIGLEVGEVSTGTAWGDTGVTVGCSVGFRRAQQGLGGHSGTLWGDEASVRGQRDSNRSVRG